MQESKEDSSVFPQGRASQLEVVRAGVARRGLEHTARSRTSQEPPRDARRAQVAVSFLPSRELRELRGSQSAGWLARAVCSLSPSRARPYLRLSRAGHAGGGPREEGLDDDSDSARLAACRRPFPEQLALSQASPGGEGGSGSAAEGRCTDFWPPGTVVLGRAGGRAAPLLDLPRAGAGRAKVT